uniref:WAP domain-containing protein n=1 Tax=Poecilia reticulata TaxID=8081 RepID=A0A3P9Q4B9_POERE
MEMYCFIKGALVFAFGLCVQGSKGTSKPGTCPKVFNTFVPAQPCFHDGYCPGEEKCCSYTGGSVCAPPILSNPECPDPQGKTGVCAELCYSDKDCLCGELCCSNGCGHECISTTPDKPGSCGSPWYFVWCGDRCQQDADCSGHLKCCPTLWGHVCQEPHLSPWH